MDWIDLFSVQTLHSCAGGNDISIQDVATTSILRLKLMATAMADEPVITALKKSITWSELQARGGHKPNTKMGEDMPEATPRDAPESTPPITPTAPKVGFLGRVSSFFQGVTGQSGSVSDMRVEDVEAMTIEELVETLEKKTKVAFSQAQLTWTLKDISWEGSIPSGPLLLPLSAHRRAGTFLRTDIKGQTQELLVEINLSRAKAAWLARNYKSMAESALKALDLSSEISHPQYTAKVCLYIAVAYFGLGDFDSGHEFLDLAKDCQGVFREGELIDWVHKEALLYQKRVGKRSTGTDSRRKFADGENAHSRGISINAPDIPGRRWHRNRRNTSLSAEGRDSLLPFAGAASPADSGSNSSFSGNVGRLGLEIDDLLEEEEEELEEEEEEVEK